MSDDAQQALVVVATPDEPSPAELDFYQRLRRRMRAWSHSKKGRSHRWTEYLLLAPDMFHLVVRLAADPTLPNSHRMRLAAVALYYAAPLDMMAEVFLGPIGFLDDLAIAAMVLNGLIHSVPPERIRHHWAGDGDVLEWLQKVVQSADEMLGKRLSGKVRRLVKSL